MKSNRKKPQKIDLSHVKKAGEDYRKIYQLYMAQPQWMTHITKESFITFLKNALESEESLRQAMEKLEDDLKKQITKKQDAGERAIEELRKNSEILKDDYRRYSAICTARQLLSLFEGKDFLYQAPNIVHADFSMYCRDN
jgi:hypothetical protein